MRIGTRGSALALVQANRVKALLEAFDDSLVCEIVVIKTQGDIDLVSPLHEIGGKGVFVKGLEEALCCHAIDAAVHSLKDVTSQPDKNLVVSGYLTAESVSDTLILKTPYQNLSELPEGAVVATGSLRRKALLTKLNPRIRVVGIRGNVHTRLEKFDSERLDGLVLSEAGLMRLGLQHRITQRLLPSYFCPAPGQGVIVIQTRANDAKTTDFCRAITDQEQAVKSRTEIAFLEKVGFDCRSPLGVYASLEKGMISFHVFLANTAMDTYFEKTYHFPETSALRGAHLAGDEAKEWISHAG